MNQSKRKTKPVAKPEPAPTASLDSEVRAKATRRTFTAAYKLAILAEVDACRESGEVGALLRREGLYSSHIANWRRLREKGQLVAASPKRGRKPAMAPSEAAQAKEIERLRKQAARLEEKLRQAEAIIDAQKKLARMLEEMDAVANKTNDSTS